jgi:hypothetical protein
MTIIETLRNEIHPAQNVEIYDNNGTLTDSSTCENLAFNISGTNFAKREVAKVDTIGYLTIINLK